MWLEVLTAGRRSGAQPRCSSGSRVCQPASHCERILMKEGRGGYWCELKSSPSTSFLSGKKTKNNLSATGTFINMAPGCCARGSWGWLLFLRVRYVLYVRIMNVLPAISEDFMWFVMRQYSGLCFLLRVITPIKRSRCSSGLSKNVHAASTAEGNLSSSSGHGHTYFPCRKSPYSGARVAC